MFNGDRKILVALLFVSILILILPYKHTQNNIDTETPSVDLNSDFIYNFNVAGILNETDSLKDSSSPYWWLDSGGVMNIENGIGSTNEGDLSPLSRWRSIYNSTNPSDTDNGYHPQNIFRLLSKSTAQNFSEEAYFRITKDNLSTSFNRNISNGLLLFMRYIDQNNLYYAGLRVDGTAVIKLKKDGEYYTLAQDTLFPGIYDLNSNPNLLPKNTWIGIRAEIVNQKDSVLITLFTDLKNDGTWTKVLEATNKTAEDLIGNPIKDPGLFGIRTDFMDVEFKNFKVSKF